MTKNKTQTVDPPSGIKNQREQDHSQGRVQDQPNQPLSGSKKVKNQNHSRNNHGEGS